jgi:U3 small nucleolar RNA-associated protein 12
MSTSHNAVKIWNPSTGSCLRTIDSDYGLCGLIIPQNKYAFVGTKSGKIEVIDIGSGTCIDTLEAHGGPVRSIAALPNENGFVTGSADHDVKFWEYQIKQKPGQVWPSILFLLFMFVLYNFLLFASIFPIENSLHVNVIMLSFGA